MRFPFDTRWTAIISICALLYAAGPGQSRAADLGQLLKPGYSTVLEKLPKVRSPALARSGGIQKRTNRDDGCPARIKWKTHLKHSHVQRGDFVAAMRYSSTVRATSSSTESTSATPETEC